jgi:VanZ family protein
MLPGGADRWIPTVLVSIAAIPVAVAASLILGRWRIRRGVAPADATRTAWTEVGIVATTVPWIWMILTPLAGPGRVYLIPFVDLENQFQHEPLWLLMQIGGNLLVFAGFGFLAPIRWPIGIGWVIVIAGLASASVESLQYLLHLGRVASVDDVLVNTIGAGLAAACSLRLVVPVARPAGWVDMYIDGV